MMMWTPDHQRTHMQVFSQSQKHSLCTVSLQFPFTETKWPKSVSEKKKGMSIISISYNVSVHRGNILHEVTQDIWSLHQNTDLCKNCVVQWPRKDTANPKTQY